MIDRITQGVQFNAGISTAEWTDGAVGQTAGPTQQALLPGSTTVSEALAAVFPKDASVAGELLAALAAAGNSPVLRTNGGFASEARRTIRRLREKGGASAAAAADELERLLNDTELLEMYRSALLET